MLSLIREDGVATRADLGRITGLSRPAVASRVASLIARGLVVERSTGPSTGGRPRPGWSSTPPAGRSSSRTSASPAASSPSATSPGRSSPAPTGPRPRRPRQDPPRLLDEWTSLLASASHRRVLDPRRRHRRPRRRRARRFGRWDAVEITGPISDRFGVPAYLDNEVNAAALGEHQAHPGVDDLLFVKVSTGIGAGLIAGGRIQRGALGAAARSATSRSPRPPTPRAAAATSTASRRSSRHRPPGPLPADDLPASPPWPAPATRRPSPSSATPAAASARSSPPPSTS